MTISMEVPAEWLAEVGLQGFRPQRSSIRCTAPHELIALNQIEPVIRLEPLDANGFRRAKMIAVLERIRDDVPFNEPVHILRKPGDPPFKLHDGTHRFHASLALGFTHVPAEIITLSF
jgi:hypothetical protein